MHMVIWMAQIFMNRKKRLKEIRTKYWQKLSLCNRLGLPFFNFFFIVCFSIFPTNIYSFNKCIWHAYHISGTMLGPGVSKGNRKGVKDARHPCPKS